jgi:pyruvate dehydrogenase E1 component beta subunit
MSNSIALAMAEEMRRDPTVLLWGLDVAEYGGAFGCSRNLLEEFGPERVFNMPISEAGYTGMGVGAATAGLRPIVELEFNDWITIASDQLVNQAANMRHQFGGKLKVPMVLRAPCGGYTCEAQHHSHMFESWFSHIPGLKVVLPSNAVNAKGLLKAAIRDDNPVIFLEHKRLYEKRARVPLDDDFTLPIGKAMTVREGSDISIVTYSYMVEFAKKAAEILAGENIDVEIVDLLTTKPMDEQAVVDTVKKTGRLIALQESWLCCSVASEVSAIAAEKAFGYLKAPVRRIGNKDVPIPFGRELSNFVHPQVEDIVRCAKELLGAV